MGKVAQHPITIFLFTLLVIVLVISLRKSGQKNNLSSEEVATLEKEAYTLSQEVQRLQSEAELSKSLEYKEKIIRNELLMQKEGEYIVQLSVPQEDLHTEEDNTVKSPLSYREQWLQILF